MGSACCVAARDQTLSSGRAGRVLQRNVPYSPSRNVLWDNRRCVTSRETYVSWSSDGIGHPDGLENKSETVVQTISEAGSPMESSQPLVWEKSPLSDGSAVQSMTPVSDISISRSISMEVKEGIGNKAYADRSPLRLSPLMPLTSSISSSPFPSRSHAFSASLTPSRCGRRAPGNQLVRQASDIRFPGSCNYSVSGDRPSPVLPGWSTESAARGSHGGSSDGWSMHGFPEFMDSSRRERWSFDSNSLCFNHDNITQYGSQSSSSPSIDLQTCDVCSKFLAEKSSFGSQKIFANNELSVVSVLICGHVYHSECLENMTPEISECDPACPVCTFGGEQALKMCSKVLKAQKDLKAKSSKRSRNRIVHSDFDSSFVALDRGKSIEHEGKGSKECSSSMRDSFQKPFLKRHFSFGAKDSRLSSENQPVMRKKGLFSTRSCKQ